MDDQTVINLISVKASEYTIREIVKNLEVKTNRGEGFLTGLIYFIAFKDINAIYRRVYNKVNPETSELDDPVTVTYTTKEQFLVEGLMKSEASKMDSSTQTMIIICVNGEKGSFAPIMSGVFNMNL